jgi:hypothetical protein
MQDVIFDIAFVYEGKTYEGWVNPSDKLKEDGSPASFHVVLDGVSFGYLSFQNCNWVVNEERPAALVKIIGRQIEKHFQL